jgi:hypothetical protein
VEGLVGDFNNFQGVAEGQPQTDRELAIVMDTIKRVNQLAIDRAPLNSQCEEVAQLIAPSFSGTFQFLAQPVNYTKRTDQQIDSNGMIALSRFTAICDSLLTPQNQIWHTLSADDEYAMKDRATKLWYYDTTRRLFKYRYSNISNFTANNQNIWTSLGAFGNGVLFIDDYYDMNHRRKALRYLSVPFGEMYLEFNHQGVVDGFIRVFRITAQQAYKIPGYAARLPAIVKMALQQNSVQKFTFVHRVIPRDSYDPVRLDFKNMPYASYHICYDTQTMLKEGGFRSLPIAASQYFTAPGELNGRSIAMDVLPALKTLNEEKKTFLQQGHRAVAPVLLLADDGLANMNMRPGSQNKGGWSSDGKPLVGTLPIGNIQISEEMMAEEKSLINDAFLVQLFSIAADPKSGTTATEVIERINEKGILIAPTLGRQTNYLGQVISRELECMEDMKLLLPRPPALREAMGAGVSDHVVYTSPLAKAARAGEASGFMRTVEGAKELVNITGDESLLDPFDFDTAIPEIADIQGVPAPWMASPDQIAQKRQARAKAAQAQQAIQAAPAAAAMIKARAAAAKSGGQGGVAPVAPAGRNLAPQRFTPGDPGSLG